MGRGRISSAFTEYRSGRGRILAEKIRENIAQKSFDHDDSSAFVTITFGVSIFKKTGANEIELCIKRADRALYKGKSKGRNKVKVDQS